jgi:hypothetical protein
MELNPWNRLSQHKWLPKPTKLAYNYNLKNLCKEKSLQLDYGEWPQHANIMEIKVFGL